MAKAPEPILFLTCGGTIDKVNFATELNDQVGDPQIKVILANSRLSVPYEIESVFAKDSNRVDEADLEALRTGITNASVRRIVVTYGTDRMVEAARSVGNTAGKTVVFTGAMIPYRFRDSEAVFNIGSAVLAAQFLDPGVYIVMHGRVFDPKETRKNMGISMFEE
ncbi:MAG: asparaginase domain-containing protein [Verrucomicrobiota bacterium]